MNTMGHILGDLYYGVAIPISIHVALEKIQISFSLVYLSAKTLQKTSEWILEELKGQ